MVQKSQWATWESVRLVILGLGFDSHHSFVQCQIVLTILTNLTNLLSRTLIKLKLNYLDKRLKRTSYSCELSP